MSDLQMLQIFAIQQSADTPPFFSGAPIKETNSAPAADLQQANLMTVPKKA
jgi:hypothetical protein